MTCVLVIIPFAPCRDNITLKFTSFLFDEDTTFFCSESFLTSAIDTGSQCKIWCSLVARPTSFSIIAVAGTEFLLTVAVLLVKLWSFRSRAQV